MKKLFPIVVTLLVLAISGCAPQVDTAADQAAIEQALRDWLEATNQPGEEGADGYASFVTEDAVWLPANAALVEGRDAVRAWILPLTQAEDFSVTWEATRVEVARAGDLAYAVGTYELTTNDAEGNPVSDKGKFVNIWKKQTDGSWKAAVGIGNSDGPAPSE